MKIDIQELHSAMERCNGNSTEAAKLLGVDRKLVWNTIHKDPNLRLRWRDSGRSKSSKPLPEPSQTAAAIYKPMEAVQQADAEALMKADKLLREGLTALGLSGERLEQSIVIQKFAGRQIRTCMDLMNGGMVKQFLDTEVEIASINKRIESGIGLDGEPMTIEEESMLRDDRARLREIKTKSFDRASRAQIGVAMLKLKASQKAEKKREPSKPGFQPLERPVDI